MKRCVLVLLVWLALPVVSRLGGDLRRGRRATLPGADGRQPLVDVRDLQRQRARGCRDPRRASRSNPLVLGPVPSGTGVTFTSLPAKADRQCRRRRRVGLPRPGRDRRSSACRCGATPPRRRAPTTRRRRRRERLVDACWRAAGDSGRGARGPGRRDLPGQRTDRARHHLVPASGNRQLPATTPVTTTSASPSSAGASSAPGRRPPSLCFTGDGADRHAHLHLQAAIVTIDDPAAPDRRLGPARRRRPPHQRDLHRRAPRTPPACAR